MRTKHGRHNHPTKLKREAKALEARHKQFDPEECQDPVEHFVKAAAGLLEPPRDKPQSRWERRVAQYAKQRVVFRCDPVPHGHIYTPPRPIHVEGVDAAADKLVPIGKYEYVRYLPLNTTYGLRLMECFVIKRNSTKFYQLAARLQDPNIQKCYHGTRGPSIIGITNLGLCQGSSGMFGGGIYVAPHLEKALDYGTYIVVCKVILGKQKEMEAAHHINGEYLWAEGFQSVWGVHDKTASYGGTLKMDEYIVYFRDQVLPIAIGRYEYVPIKLP